MTAADNLPTAENVADKKKKTSNKRIKTSAPFNSKPWEHFDHVIMNLPASAIQFIGNFSPASSILCTHPLLLFTLFVEHLLLCQYSTFKWNWSFKSIHLMILHPHIGVLTPFST